MEFNADSVGKLVLNKNTSEIWKIVSYMPVPSVTLRREGKDKTDILRFGVTGLIAQNFELFEKPIEECKHEILSFEISRPGGLPEVTATCSKCNGIFKSTEWEEVE